MSKSSFSLKRRLGYFLLTIILSLIGYIAVIVTVLPLVSPFISSMGLVMSATDSTDDLKTGSIFEPKVDLAEKDTVNEKDIVMPVYGTHYAKLEIPALSVSVDLYFGDSSQVLKKGVGQYIGSSLPGYGRPILIGGHNNGAFNALQRVKVGDTVAITTNYGVYQYRVTGTSVADQSDKSAYDLSQNKEQLILYTCYPFNTLGLTNKRFFVYGDKISGPEIVTD